MRTLRGACLVSVVLGVLSSAQAVEPGVRDTVGMFSIASVRQANELISGIRKHHGKDVLIETFPEIPRSLQAEFNRTDKDQFYREWCLTRATDLGVDGVYMLIVKTPGRLEIGIGKQTRAGIFSDSDRDAVRDRMLAALRRGDADAALLEGVREVQDRMSENAVRPGMAARGEGGAVAPVPGEPSLPVVVSRWIAGAGKWICLGVAALAVWAMIRAARSARSGGPGSAGTRPGFPGATPGDYGQGHGTSHASGGGFGRGLMGGLLGGVMGGWLADRWSGGRSNQARADQGDAGAPFGGPMSSGGDFGSSDSGGGSSGGDFGGDGGSSSGGDF